MSFPSTPHQYGSQYGSQGWGSQGWGGSQPLPGSQQDPNSGLSLSQPSAAHDHHAANRLPIDRSTKEFYPSADQYSTLWGSQVCNEPLRSYITSADVSYITVPLLFVFRLCVGSYRELRYTLRACVNSCIYDDAALRLLVERCSLRFSCRLHTHPHSRVHMCTHAYAVCAHATVVNIATHLIPGMTTVAQYSITL